MQAKQADNQQEQPFISHLLELRDRILRMVLAVLAIFLVLFPFANDIYQMVAAPLMAHLPEGTSMIATEVASPFLTPFKLSLVASVFFAMPFILYQFWSFVAPGLYRHEQQLALPILVSSIVLFYLGMLFAYYVVFPLVFAFLTGAAPDGVAVMTDISRYLDFVLTLFFAFGIAFEIPIATFVMVWMGITTPDKLVEKRPYIIVGVFLVGMLLTPPDVISQTLLALPMWLLFEAGILFARMFINKRKQAEEREENESKVGFGENSGEGFDPKTEGKAVNPVSRGVESGRFVPLTDEELEAELDAIEAEEENEGGPDRAQESKKETESPAEAEAPDGVDAKLERVKKLRDLDDLEGARGLLYEVLEEGDAGQRRVARNILAQLDS